MPEVASLAHACADTQSRCRPIRGRAPLQETGWQAPQELRAFH